jgi:hypothetical protein
MFGRELRNCSYEEFYLLAFSLQLVLPFVVGYNQYIKIRNA